MNVTLNNGALVTGCTARDIEDLVRLGLVGNAVTGCTVGVAVPQAQRVPPEPNPIPVRFGIPVDTDGKVPV